MNNGERSELLKLFLGMLACWPLLYVVIVVAILAMIPWGSGDIGAIEESSEYQLLEAMGVVYVITAILMLSLIFNFIWHHIFRGDRVPEEKRILWAVLLVSLNVFALPVFWYLYIWREEEYGDWRR